MFAAKLEGRDPAAEKREAKRRVVADRMEDLLETFIEQRVSQNRSAGSCVEKWGHRGLEEASTKSPKAMWLRSSQRLSNAEHRALPTRL